MRSHWVLVSVRWLYIAARIDGMKLALALFAATVALTACRQPEVAAPQPDKSQVNPLGYYPGRPPTAAEAEAYRAQLPTPESLAADKRMAKLIIGRWTESEHSDSAGHQTWIINADGTYMAQTEQGKLLSKGTWAVDRGALLLRYKNTTPPPSNEFHHINQLDSHNLVCGIGISTAGRFRFTRGEPPLAVFIGGQFMNPGIYTWTNGMTLTDSFALAGGFNQFAWHWIRLEHWDGSTERFRWSATHPFTNNPILRPGDKIMNPVE